MWREYINAANLDDALEALASGGASTRVVAGGTDLILELERGARKGITCLVDVTRVPGLNQITLDGDGWLHLGPMVTHNQCVASELIREFARPLAEACWEVGSPQIRNRGTIAGNLITASPANDTISPLTVLGAELDLRSVRAERVVPIDQFYAGVRRTVMQDDEMLVDIRFPAMRKDQRGTFLKYALRRAQAISLVNVAIVLDMDGDQTITHASVAFGAVAPTIIHTQDAEQFLVGKALTSAVIQQASLLAAEETRPISDVRGSAGYRKAMARVICQRGLKALGQPNVRSSVPEDPVLLWGKSAQAPSLAISSRFEDDGEPIVAMVNGQEKRFFHGKHKTLLRLLREDGLLIGTKEGCAEGECGACTVFLDGMAVMACMVPAPRAHGAEIVTVEGLGQDGHLHPVQEAFVSEGAVQCGYCTPGFLMSAVKLLEEKPHPGSDEIKQALTGNLCRCTGYYKIVQAIELAAGKEVLDA